MKCWMCCFLLGLLGFCCKSQSDAWSSSEGLSEVITAGNRNVSVVKSWLRQRTLMQDNDLYVSASLAMYRSTIPFTGSDGADMRRCSHYMIPLVLGYQLDDQFSAEAGIFGGLLRNRLLESTVLSDPISPDLPATNSLNMGLVAGFSYRIDKLVKVNLHCWYGHDTSFNEARGIQFGWSIAF